ncbi:uncharacterized protein LOC131944026 isoform X2 [Physella acuta]|uniref:uncharacterized protein LOC131944026 isoform X2 n=1 Tax=Physella acuta TaxID=109671 RepID=UPI0027DBFFD2|nr:uncharacterized protein LOC131944026 isoform X2 [Physella acuta]
MDNVLNFHGKMLWIAIIVLVVKSQGVTGTSGTCPQGQLAHMDRNLVLTCCFPTRCGIGMEVMVCTINGTQDTCQVCSARYNQSLRTSSYTMERCKSWPLDDKCSNGKRDSPIDEDMKRCMCNLELGLKYERPEIPDPSVQSDSNCQRIPYPCKVGEEPTVEGSCQPCQENYFKSEENYNLCEPLTNCTMLGLSYISHGTREADSLCSKPVLVTTTIKPVVPDPPTTTASTQKTQVTSTTIISTPTVLTPTYAPSKKHEAVEDASLLGPVIGSVAFVLVVILVILIILLYKRRRDCSKNCADSEIGLHTMPGDMRAKNVCANVQQFIIAGGDKANNNITGEYHQSPPGTVWHPPSNDSQFHFPDRKGILRNAVIGQTKASSSDQESIGPEKLLVERSEPNPDLGENDPLLVPETPQRSVAFQNLAASNSPPGQPMRAPLFIPSTSFVKNVPASPPLDALCLQHPMNGCPPALAMFTRSTSVIASPEGEVDDEAIEARVPRFSQLLPDNDTPLNTSNPVGRQLGQRELLRSDSPGQTTQQIRAPSERVNQQRAHRPGRVGFSPQPSSQESNLDHRIMNLKEQELAESLHSACENSSISLNLHAANDSDEQTLNTQQTQLKSQLRPDYGARAELLMLPTAVISELSADADHIGGERRRPPTGGVERKLMPAGHELHKSYSKPSSEEAARNVRYNRTVSFEEEENAQEIVFKQGGDMEHSACDKVQVDPDQKAEEGNCRDDEETERKSVTLELKNSSTGSSKTSVNSDITDTNQGSPSRAAFYRRSQSENAPSSTDSIHKPPPRSMSEEKPQKTDRPVAKVKPMPASDNTINLLPAEGLQIPATALDDEDSDDGVNNEPVVDDSDEDSEESDVSSQEENE